MPEPESDTLTAEEARAVRLQKQAFREALEEHEAAKEKRAADTAAAAAAKLAEEEAAKPKPKAKKFGLFIPMGA